MIITTEGGLTVLTPENKAYLSDGETYSQKVYLGKYDSADNWYETDDVEDIIAGSQEITAEEALSIITGGEGV
jgi:hypothetical protein